MTIETKPLTDLIQELAEYDRREALVKVPERGLSGAWEITETPHQGEPVTYTLYGTAEEVLLEMIHAEQARTSDAAVGPWSAEEVEAIQRRCGVEIQEA